MGLPERFVKKYLFLLVISFFGGRAIDSIVSKARNIEFLWFGKKVSQPNKLGRFVNPLKPGSILSAKRAFKLLKSARVGNPNQYSVYWVSQIKVNKP